MVAKSCHTDGPHRLIKYDTFSEDVTKFYMAECILAIEAVHNLGFIHRCVEPWTAEQVTDV